MLWNASHLTGYSIQGADGFVGTVNDFYFDDERWTVRWVVVDIGKWLPGRRVLLSPVWLKAPSAPDRDFVTGLTREQVKNSPDVDTDKPVSRQHEARLYAHYGGEPYWAMALGDPMLGAAGAPLAPLVTAGSKPTGADTGAREEKRGDPHLRSLREVTGYAIQATDGEIGHIEDFLLDTENWAIRYVVVDTRNWWPGKKTLVAPKWLSDMDWESREVRVGVTRDAIKQSPEYDPTKTVDRAYEARLHEHYGYPGNRL